MDGFPGIVHIPSTWGLSNLRVLPVCTCSAPSTNISQHLKPMISSHALLAWVRWNMYKIILFTPISSMSTVLNACWQPCGDHAAQSMLREWTRDSYTRWWPTLLREGIFTGLSQNYITFERIHLIRRAPCLISIYSWYSWITRNLLWPSRVVMLSRTRSALSR